jgi:hypothetical protein
MEPAARLAIFFSTSLENEAEPCRPSPTPAFRLPPRETMAVDKSGGTGEIDLCQVATAEGKPDMDVQIRNPMVPPMETAPFTPQLQIQR